jgi:hypothetical protein
MSSNTYARNRKRIKLLMPTSNYSTNILTNSLINSLTKIVGLLVKSISTFGWRPKAFSLKMLRFVLSGETAVKGKSKKLIAYPIFLFEKMPTVKIKMPDKVAVQPRQPESKEQLVQKLYRDKIVGE